VRRPSLILALLATCVLGLSAWLLLRPQHTLPEDALAALPSDAYGVVGIRVKRVLASQAWQRLVVERGEARGIERAVATCGFNPLAGVDQLTVLARPQGREPTARFAFTARGRFKHEQLIDCARKLSGRSGLKLVHEEIEGIHSVRSEQGSTRIALLGRDGIVGGDADSVREVILALRGKRPSLAASSGLAGLYRALSTGSDLTAVARSPAQFLPLLGKAGRVIDAQALALDEVTALGARLVLQPEAITATALLVTQREDQARRLAELARAQRERILSIPLIGLTGVAAPLRAATVEVKGREVRVTSTLGLGVAEALLELFAL
jgi:hypothetical protein